MLIACLCPTYNRPLHLPEAVESFRRQTYPDRELVVLDDAGQWKPQAGDRWRLVSARPRYRTLGDKRNATAALVPEADAYAVWDDDDIYLPGHLEALAACLAAGADWVRPDYVWTEEGSTLALKRTGGAFHGSWGFTRAAFESVGGYPAMDSGQDKGLAERLLAAGYVSVSPAGPPTYIYRWWSVTRHISALGPRGYRRRGQEKIVCQRRLVPGWARDWARLAQSGS